MKTGKFKLTFLLAGLLIFSVSQGMAQANEDVTSQQLLVNTSSIFC